jgi:acyl-CoA synthetase (AMP-forming)/AMP-acid ligase II
MRTITDNDVSTLPEAVACLARDHPSGTAWIAADEHVSFREFERRCWRVANRLDESGLQRDGRIAFICRNSAAVYELLFGAAMQGCVLAGVNWRLAPAEIAFILRDSGAKLLFVAPEFTEAVREALAIAEVKADIVELGEEYSIWRDRCGARIAPQVYKAADVVCQLYTSGTTGSPKGVLLSHASFLEMLRSEQHSGDLFDLGPEDVTLVCSPLFHIGGLSMGLTSFLRGSVTVLCESSPAEIIAAVGRHRVTTTFLVPSLLQLVIEDASFSSDRVASLRLLRYGASPISSALLRRAREVMVCDFAQMYGMTECCGAVFCLRPEDHLNEDRLVSCGRPLANVEVMIADAQGVPLPSPMVGEVCIRSPAIMRGYWRQPQATAEAFFDDWYRTGDAGQLDAENYLYLRDRVKDMIVSGGENIYPAEVENAIAEHHDVAEVAVIGIPDDKWGEAVRAVVVLKPGATTSERDIIAAARTRIAGYKVPKSVEFVTDLPRNGAGKVLRRSLRDAFWQGRGRSIG